MVRKWGVLRGAGYFLSSLGMGLRLRYSVQGKVRLFRGPGLAVGRFHYEDAKASVLEVRLSLGIGTYEGGGIFTLRVTPTLQIFD